MLAPPPIDDPRGPIAPKFAGGEAKAAGLAGKYRKVSAELGCHFLDAATVTPSSRADGVHLDADQHARLGEAMAGVVGPVIAR